MINILSETNCILIVAAIIMSDIVRDISIQMISKLESLITNGRKLLKSMTYSCALFCVRK